MKMLHHSLCSILIIALSLLMGCSQEPSESESSSSDNTQSSADSQNKQDKAVWRFALEEIEGSVQDAYAKEFKKRIESKSNGVIQVEIYPYGSLGTSSQLTELVQGGAIELAFASPGHLASVIPEVGVFTLHFVLSDNNEINKQVLSSDRVHQILAGPYQAQSLHLMSIIPEGWMVWTGNKPLTTLDAFEGFKMRTMTSPILVNSYKAYGANPTPLPYAEVYSALQLGQIDGEVNPIFAIEEMKFYEEQDVMTMAKHAQFITTLVAGQTWQQQLSKQQQQWLDETVNGMVDWIYTKQKEYNLQRLEKIKAAGGTEIVELTSEQREAFREASKSVQALYIEQAGENGKTLLETITSMVAELEATTAVNKPK